MKNCKNFSLVLTTILFSVGGVSFVNGDDIVDRNFTVSGDATKMLSVSDSTLNFSWITTVPGKATYVFVPVKSDNSPVAKNSQSTLIDTNPNSIAQAVVGGYANSSATSVSGNSISISGDSQKKLKIKKRIIGGYNHNNGSIFDNRVTISNANLESGASMIVGGFSPSNADIYNNKVIVTNVISTSSKPNVSLWGARSETIGNLYNNDLIIKDSYISYNAGGARVAGVGSGGEANNNHVEITNSIYGSIWGGWALATSGLNHSKYNTVIINGSQDNTKEKTDKLLLRAGTSHGEGDSSYNTISFKNTTINNSSVEIQGGLSQGSAMGNANYNQLILDDTNITKATLRLFAGSVGQTDEKPEKSDNHSVKVAIGNRAYINNSVYEGNYTVGGGTESGDTSDNIVVINGDNTKLKGAYGGEVRTATDATAKDNLVIMSGGTINENIYGGYTQGGDTSGNTIYLIKGEVSGIVGGGNNGNKNTLILGNSTSDFGIRKAGQISNFNTLQFNAVKDGTSADAVLTLTDSANGADLNGVAINFINKDAIDRAVEVVVGGNNGVGVNEKRNNGGGANAIRDLTKNAIKYGANLDTIAVVVSGVEAKNDIIENLQRTLSDGTTKDKQTSYGIGDTFNYKYETIDLKQPNKKYYLIKSNAPLQNYDKIKLENPANPTWIGKELKENSGIKIADIYQPDQIYKILSSEKYTRNLRGMFVENGDKDLFITGIDEITESWNDNEFDTNEFSKFNQPSNTGNQIYIEANAGDLGGKTIYGGYGDSEDVNNNNIYINQNAKLSNATIIGGYSEKGNVSDNNITLNDANIKADIILAQIKEDGAEVKVSNDNIIMEADKVTIGGSVTIAKSTGSANLNGLNFEMPKFKEITGDFTLADTNTGSANENSLTLNNDINVGGNIYTAKSLGNANKNTLTLNGNVKANEIYVAKGANEANTNILEIKSGTIASSKVIVGSAKSANDNIANFNSGEITGTLVGGNIDGTGNTLNVNSTKLKAGNVENFQIINFKKNYLSRITSSENSMLILTSGDNTNLSGVEVQIGDAKYDPSSDYGLSSDNKYYLISNSGNLDKFKELSNYNASLGGAGQSITHASGGSGFVIDALQTNKEYLIDNPKTFKRNLNGMFVGSDSKTLYLTQNDDIIENITDTIGGKDFFTKFGESDTKNTITISPKDGNEIDLSGVTFDGNGKDSENTLNVGTFAKPISIKAKDITDFSNINIYLPENPNDGYTAISLDGGSNTNLSNSNINVVVNNLGDINDNGGTVHLVKAKDKIDKNADIINVQVGALVQFPRVAKQNNENELNLFAKEKTCEELGNCPDPVNPDPDPVNPDPDPVNPDPKPSPTPNGNKQTKIFNEARLGSLGALWQGQYLIANHLDRVIPDAFSELFPYAIAEGYDKRFNTGSHVDTRGFNANAGFASKGANSSGEFTMGPFIEYGRTNYDAYLDDGTHGDGKNYYIGGGFFGKQENNSGSYFEATFRVGQLVTKFNGDLSFNGARKNYDFDLKSTYIAAHAGLGKIYNLNANNDLDIYGRFFYTHIESTDITLDDVKIEFDAVQSKKIRLGFKDDYKFNQNHAIYAGAAYEYEFDAKAGGKFLVPGYDIDINKPSLRGSTGIGEIGYEYKKDEMLKFDVGVKGYVGKQEGVSAQMAISIAF